MALAHLLAVASPGPDFAVVVQHSLRFSRKTAYWTSIGIGLGILIHVGYAALGIGLLLQSNVWIYQTVLGLGATYLIWLGLQALSSRDPSNDSRSNQLVDRASPHHPARQLSSMQALKVGFLTNVLNPKATLFFLALFTAVVSPETPAAVLIIYALWLATATTLWFMLVSLLLDSQDWIRRYSHWIDRAMGTVLFILGIQIITMELLPGLWR